MMKISCKLKNSYGIDDKGDLYAWGSHSNGMLGIPIESDQYKPMRVPLKYGKNSFMANKVSAGHFHTAVIADRQGAKNPREIRFAKMLFLKTKNWFEKVFVTMTNNPNKFIDLVLQRRSPHEAVPFIRFQELILKGFFADMKQRGKNQFKIEEVYKQVLLDTLKVHSDFGEIDPNQINEFLKKKSSNEQINEVQKYILTMFKHFNSFKDDFPHFIKMILAFKEHIDVDDMKKFFQYVFPEGIDAENQNKIENVAKEITSMKGNREVIEINDFIDTVLEHSTGFGKLFTWGVDTHGRLGYTLKEMQVGEEDDEGSDEDEVLFQSTPKIVNFPRSATIVTSVSCGYAHTLALTKDGLVYSWGISKFGCLGNNVSSNLKSPKLIPTSITGTEFNEIIEIGAGTYFNVALNADGDVFSWGCGNNGRLGHNNETSVENPKKIDYFYSLDIKIRRISVGDTHCCAISNSKEFFTWGSGNYGKLGHGNYYDQLEPKLLEYFKSIKIYTGVCGSYSTMAISSENKVYAWGKNAHGLLGVPHMAEQNCVIPNQITIKQDEKISISDVSLGTMHSMILFSNGTLFTCGNSMFGVLGLPDVIDKITVPKLIKDTKFSRMIKIDIKEKSIFKDYDDNYCSNIRNEEVANSLIYVDCSTNNTAFIDNLGNLYMCGENRLIAFTEGEGETPDAEEETPGELENEATDAYIMNWRENIIHINVPYFNEKVDFVAVGRSHCIVIANNIAYSWGDNTYGKLGLTKAKINSYVTSPQPIEKVGNNVRMACLSDTHSLLLALNGEVYSFGQNLYGKLGIGDISKYFMYDNDQSYPYESEPQQVKGVTVADYIACSSNHSALIMKFDNNRQLEYSVYTWGSGFAGRLGHGAVKDEYEPKRIEELRSVSSSYFVKVACGEEFTIALDINGQLWGWGRKKYLLPGFAHSSEIATSPIQLDKTKKFKYISCSENLCSAIDEFGGVYIWGKEVVQDKAHVIEFTPEAKINISDKVIVSAVGFNHFSMVSDDQKSTFTWGSNLFFKCGQNAGKISGNEDGKEENIPNPKKLEYFYDIFLKNENRVENIHKLMQDNDKKRDTVSKEKENKDSVKETPSESSQSKVVDPATIQQHLLEEKEDEKNEGTLISDMKLNKKLYENLGNFTITMRTLNVERNKCLISTQNSIIRKINSSNAEVRNNFVSEVPKIINLNFQIYEAFLTILQIHPCFIVNTVQTLKNKKELMTITKYIYGTNQVKLRNPRTISMLMGLFNAVFKMDKTELRYNQEKLEISLTYQLYNMLFKISNENTNFIRNLIAEVVMLVIREVLSYNFTDSTEILVVYNHCPEEQKAKIFHNIIDLMTKKITEQFKNMNEGKSSGFLTFSQSVCWMLKVIRNEYFDEESSDISNTPFAKIILFFLFNPLSDYLNKFKETSDLKNSSDFYLLYRAAKDILNRNKNDNNYSMLYNQNKSKDTIFPQFINLLGNKSDVLNLMIKLFEDLRSNVFAYDHSRSEVKEKVNVLLKVINEALSSFDYDFSLTALKQFIQNTSENFNESSVLSLRVSDLIDLQSIFLKAYNPENNDENNPLHAILEQLSAFKLEEIETTSKILKFVLNFRIKPYTFMYEQKGFTLLRCQHCLLPIPDIFFKMNDVNDAINGRNWGCCQEFTDEEGNKKQEECINDPNTVICKHGVFKTKKDHAVNTFITPFEVLETEEKTILFEEVLYLMPTLGVNDDILKEAKTLLTYKRKSQNKKDIEQAEMIERFINISNLEIGGNEDSDQYIKNKILYFEHLFAKVTTNIEARIKHRLYRSSIQHFFSYMETSMEDSKNLIAKFQNDANMFTDSLEGDNSNVKTLGSTCLKMNKTQSGALEMGIIKKYMVGKLMSQGVIDEIKFEGATIPKVAQKCYLVFEKSFEGYKCMLNFKEKSRKYIVCGTINHEYTMSKFEINNNLILEWRRLACTNAKFTVEGIRFNIFNLVKLLNSMEVS